MGNYPIDDKIQRLIDESARLREGAWRAERRNIPPIKEEPKIVATERTPLSHVAHALQYIFGVLVMATAGVSAIIGLVEAWLNLPWIYATYITVGAASLVIGTIWYLDEGV